MSEENVAIVGAAFAAFDRGDTEAVLRLCDEDIVVTQPPELPGVPAEQHGHSGVLEAFAIWPEQWKDFRVEVLRIAGVAADKVFVVTRNRGRGRQSGVEVDMEISLVFTVRDARITEMRIFMQESDAREAAGLRE